MARARLVAGLTLSTSTFAVQHRPMCTWSLSNSGVKAIAIAIPIEVSLRVVSARTGRDEVFSPRHAGNVARMRMQETVEVAAGKPMSGALMLDALVPDLVPGAYEISAIVRCGDDGPSLESEPVRMTVLPATPQRLSLASINGGDSSFSLGAWVNCATEPPAVMLSQFSFSAGGGASTLGRIADARLMTAPVVSAPPNQSVASGQWIAWIDGHSVVAVLHDPEKGATEPRRLDLDEDGAYLVKPLLAIDDDDDDGPVTGATLVCIPGFGGDATRLVSIALTEDTLTTDGSLELTGAAPHTIESRVFSDGTRVALVLQEDDEDVILSVVGWPGDGSPGIEQKRLASWSGRAVGTGSMMTDDDELVGALLGWMDVTDDEGLEQTEQQFIRFTVSQTGTYRETARVRIEWVGPAHDAIVRVNADGHAYALIRDEAHRWSFVDHEGRVRMLSEPAGPSARPFEIGLMGFEPVIVWGLEEVGFMLTQGDGLPLPPEFEP